MKNQSFRNLFLVSVFGIIFSTAAISKDLNSHSELIATEGSVTLVFTSVNNGDKYAPKNVLAVWVEKADGTFIKSLKVRADKRKQYLYSWNSKSSGNTTDATTGSTLSSHQTHTVTWNLTDVGGTVVEDGNYTIRIEYTSEHAQGPLSSVSFTKGTDPVTTNPSDETYFKNISLTYTPDASTGLEYLNAQRISIYPVPATDNLIINRASGYVVNVYDHSGRVIRSIQKIPSDYFEVNISDMTPGSYIIVGSRGDETFRQIIQVTD